MDNVRIILKLDHNVTYMEGRLSSEEYKSFKQEMGYYPDDSHWMVLNIQERAKKDPKKRWMADWDGLVSTVCYNQESCKCFVKKKGPHFPTGLLSKARKFFENFGITYKIYDLRPKLIGKDLNLSMSPECQQRDYQQRVVVDAVKVKRGIFQAATGAGKTAIAANVIQQIALSPTIFFVTSKDLLYQAQTELERFILQDGQQLKVGIIGDGQCIIRDINIMTVQTAIRCLGAKYVKFDEDEPEADDEQIDTIKEDVKKLVYSAKVMYCDEVQHWAAETCQILSDCTINCHYRYGGSATPWRDKNDDILIDACFGKCIGKISASFLIEQGELVRPTIYFIEVPVNIHITKSTYANIYKQAVVNNHLRNKWIANIAQSMEKSGRNILILCNRLAHGKLLQSMIPGSVFLHGECRSKIRKAHLDKMRAQDTRVTIATVIFDEGIDCKPLDTLILAGSGKSQTRALQRIGRIIRKSPNKRDAIVIDFLDGYKYLEDHSRARLKIYQTEPEFVIKRLKLDEDPPDATAHL